MVWKTTAAILLASMAWAQPPGGGPPGGGPGGGSDGIWRRDAFYGERETFDSCIGHQPGDGEYHYHANPLCLRAELDDNVVILRSTRTGSAYSELASGWHHSPILGWAVDGYPIYGPYGYADPKNPSSAIKRIKSGFRLRNITERSSLPDWSMPNHANVSQTLAANQYGPPINAVFPLGRYLEDYEWSTTTGDLDQYNGRFTVTPDFPAGTYAYYVTINDAGTPAFPYVVGGELFGTVGNRFSTTGASSASTYFDAGTYASGPSTPQLTSWATKNSTTFATIVSGFDPAAGPVTTWPGTNTIGVNTNGSVTTPALAGPQRIQYSDSTVFMTATGLAGNVPMGPWFGVAMTGGVFNNFPSVKSKTIQLPRIPSAAATRTATGLGALGMWVNGVAVFNFLDGASYSNASGTDAGGGGTISTYAVITSAASFEQGPQAPGALLSAFPLFHSVLSTTTESATSADWPSSLGGASVSVRDSAGTSRDAQILYASPALLNFRMPPGSATGAGTVTITAGSQTITSRINVQPVYPSLFLANATALATGHITRARNGVNTVTNIDAAPIALGQDEVYLTLYGTGLGSATTATATVGGMAAAVSYAGPQGTYAGLDQFNLLIPPGAAGKGKVDIVITAGGKASNAVNVTIR